MQTSLRERLRWVLRVLLGLAMLGAGANHFLHAEFYEAIMPGYLPAHGLLVALSGVAEIFIGALLLVRRTAEVAGWLSIALLVAVFPANVNMALHPEQFPDLPVAGLYIRLPIQGLLVAWAWWCTRPAQAFPGAEEAVSGG